MPALDASINTLRQRYDFRTYITTPTETVVFSRAVNMATITYPLTSITYDNPYSGTGSTSDVLEDMEILVYSANTSTLKGRLRVANGGASATVIQVNEIAAGRLSLADNDRFDVVRSWRVRDRLVGATSTFPKDSRIAYSDQGSNPQPVCNSGGHWAGFVDDNQTYATVQFTGSTSFNVDPDSAATVNHSWTFPSGTPSTSTSADPSVQFPAGAYWVTHVATDASNSKTETQYVFVRVYNHTTDRPTDCLVDDMSATITDGWRCRVTVPTGWSTTDAPDGALVIVWERETYGGVVQSFGANTTGRSHIKMVGYIASDTVSRDYEAGTVSFDLINPVALLAQLPGFSQVLNIKASPTNWRQLKGLTTNRALIYLLRWGTTLLRTFDLILAGNNYNYPQLYVQAQTPDTQIREITDGIASAFTCDRRGRVAVQLDLLQATTAQRSAATTTLTLTDSDIAEFEFTREHRYQYNTLKGVGFTAATTLKTARPVLSLAPGKAPSEAPQTTSIERMIVTDQSDLNTRTGFLYAKQNSLSNGLPVARGSITLPGHFDVFDTYAEWVGITLASSYDKRGITRSATRHVITGISVEYSNGENASKRVRLTVQEETTGAAGVTKNPPTTAKNNVPNFTLPEISFPYIIPTTPVGLQSGVGTVAVLGNDRRWYITSDFNASVVTWVSSAQMSMLGTLVDFVVDPFSPRYVAGTGAVNGWAVTSTGIYSVGDIFGSIIVTLLFTFPAATTLRSLSIGRNIQNFVMVTSNYRSVGGVVIATCTDGVTFTEYTITTDYNTTTGGTVLQANNMVPGGVVSEHIAGRIYVGAFTSTGAGASADSALYTVDNYGAGTPTLTTLMTNEVIQGGQFHFPFHNNATDSLFYWTKDVDADEITLGRTRPNPSTGAPEQQSIDVYAGAGTAGPLLVVNGVVHPFDSHPLNNQRLAMVGSRGGTALFNRDIYLSPNGGSTWYPMGVEANSNRWNNIYFDGSNQDVLYVLGENGKIGQITGFGAALIDKSPSAVGAEMIAIVGN